MIGTVTLNPCVDRTCHISGFEYGGMNRMIDDRRDVSGKGINVSLALKQMNWDVKTTGFLYKGNKEFFLEELTKSHIEYDGIEVEGVVRENIKLWDTNSNITTEINQKGAFVSEEKCQEFKEHFTSWVSSLDVVVLSGSVPVGIDNTIYKDLIEIASLKGVKSVLDAEGELLNEGLKAKPYLIKPNKYEFCLSFKTEDDSLYSIAKKAKEIVKDGVCSICCVTLGKDGALIVSKDGVWFSPSPSVDIKCTQGAGDSVVAGMCIALERGLDVPEMLRYGVTMATGTLTREGTQMCGKDEFDRFLPLVEVSKFYGLLD